MMAKPLLAALASGLFATLAAAQAAAPSSASERTFFGYTVGEVAEGWPQNKGSPYNVGRTEFWQDRFKINASRVPKFINGDMKVRFQMSNNGILQSVTFEMNNFLNLTELTTTAIRAKRFDELVAVVSEKMGTAPTGRKPAPYKLSFPRGGGRYFYFDPEVVYWIRPWGEVLLWGCGYDEYFQKCDSDAFVPSLVVLTNAILEADRLAIEDNKKNNRATDAARLKM